MEAEGHGGEGDRKDGRNGAVPGSYVQRGGPVGAITWQQEIGGDRGDAQGPGGVPPSGGVMVHRDDVKTQSRRRVGVPLGRGGNGRRGVPTHKGVHKEAEDDHSIEGGLLPYL